MFVCMNYEYVKPFDMYTDCTLMHDMGPYKTGQLLKMICYDRSQKKYILYVDGTDPVEVF